MKLGRVVLTYRPDLIPALKEFYLGQGRTEFLVIAYNKQLVNPEEFKQEDNFKLEPYLGEKSGGNITGQQFFAWLAVVKNYPNIDAWVMHDYDLLVRPSDKEIFKHISKGGYASLGKPFANWQEGMTGNTTEDVFPYPYHIFPPEIKKMIIF